MKRFSERNGFVREVIHPPETITTALRNRLWNIIEASISYADMGEVSVALWHQFYKLPLSTRGQRESYDGIDWSQTWAFIQRQFSDGPWYAAYDHVEFLMAGNYLKESDINRELTEESAPYRSVNRHIVQITHEAELAEIEAASDEQDVFASSSQHIRTALKLLSDRAHPDFRNSIKESISAVESVGKVLSGSSRGTLDDALRTLSKRPLYGPALLDGFRKIYGWSSDAQGIRHSMKESSTLGYAEAKFFLVACSAFANYLRSVGEVEKAGQVSDVDRAKG